MDHFVAERGIVCNIWRLYSQGQMLEFGIAWLALELKQTSTSLSKNHDALCGVLMIQFLLFRLRLYKIGNTGMHTCRGCFWSQPCRITILRTNGPNDLKRH